MSEGPDSSVGTSRRDEENSPECAWQPPEPGSFQTSAQYSFQTPAQYFEALEKWTQAAKMWQLAMASFPFFVMSNQHFFSSHQNSQLQFSNAFGSSNVFSLPNLNLAPQPQVRETPQANARAGVEYRVAPVWKRVIAEVIDFLLLTFIKLTAGIVAAYLFGFVHWNLLSQSRKWDLNLSLDSALQMLESDEVTPEILILELLNIAIACVFEAFWMRKDFTGRGKGATPGKALMGIRVVRCVKVLAVEGRPPEVILVQPGTEVKLLWSVARSFLKNLILAMLLPLTFVLFFFKHYRTGYDVMCRTIVVEDTQRQ